MRLLAILGLVLACGGGPVLFRSEHGRFSIMMPARPREYTAPPGAGEADRSHTIAAESPGALYGVIYTDLVSAPQDPHAFLAARHDLALRSAPGVVVTNRRIVLDGNPGLEVEVRFPNATRARTRYYLVDRRLYEVHMFGRPEDFFPDQFFQSFALR